MSQVESCTSFTKKKTQDTLLVERREFRGKSDSGQRIFSGKIFLVIYCTKVSEGPSSRAMRLRKDGLVSQTLSRSASLLVPDMVSGLCLKDYMCTINTLYHLGKISKLSMLLIS